MTDQQHGDQKPLRNPGDNPGDNPGADPGLDPEYMDQAMKGLSGGPGGPVSMKHPKGLWVLFITEMWERFSYYGMRAILALYLAHTAVQMDAGRSGVGFGWDQADASVLYGIYTFMVYVTSIFGGMAADRFLGTHRSMLFGGSIIAVGHICLAFTELFKAADGTIVTPETASSTIGVFLLGLTFIIIGTGFFKPCVSVMVGQLYRENDPRRDSGFTIFYMGINLGAALSPLVAGTLAQRVGWHWGFGSAAVGMIIGLVTYSVMRSRYLRGIGDAPERSWDGTAWLKFGCIIAGLVAIPLVPMLLYLTGNLDPITNAWTSITGTLGVYGTAAAIAGLILAACVGFLMMQMPEHRSRIAVIFILAILGNIFFWVAFEQAGTSMNFFATDSTDLTIYGLWEAGMPSTWYQSVNAFTIVLCAPIFSWLWIWLARRRKDPSTPMKFAIGLWLLGLSFIAMVFGAMDARDGLAGPHWLFITYVVYTWGELCLSPVGLSMVTKLAPKHLQSLLMGIWFMSLALSNLIAGLVAAFAEKFDPASTAAEELQTFIIPGQAGFYLMLVVFPVGSGLVIALLTPLMKKMMRGIH